MFWLPGGKQKMEFQLALVTLNCDHHTYATLHSAPVHSLLFARMDLKWWFSNLLTTFSLGSYTASNCFFLLHFSFLCHAEQAIAAVDFRFMLRLNKLILYRIYQSAHYVSYLHPQNAKIGERPEKNCKFIPLKYTVKNRASIYRFDIKIDIFLSEIQFLKCRLCSFISIIIWFILILSI